MSVVAAAIVGGAVVGAGGAIYASNQASDASEAAAQAQTDTSMASLEMQERWLEINRQDIKDAVDAGLIDLETGYNQAVAELQPYAEGGIETLNTARDLLEDPTAIMDRPSYQFQYDQGIEALQAAYSRTGGGGVSGSALKAAQQFGQNLASTSLDAELNRLFPFINLAAQSSEQLANLHTAFGANQANLRAAGATGTAAATGTAVTGMSNTIQNQGVFAANNAINQANINANLASNLTNIGTGIMNYAAANPDLFSSFGGS